MIHGIQHLLEHCRRSHQRSRFPFSKVFDIFIPRTGCLLLPVEDHQGKRGGEAIGTDRAAMGGPNLPNERRAVPLMRAAELRQPP